MLKIFRSVKKELSLSINFKELVGWKKPSALEREDETDSWWEKDSLPGFERVSSPFKGSLRRWQRILHCLCLWSGDLHGWPRNVLLSKVLHLCFTHWIDAFHDSKKLPFNFFSFFFFYLFHHLTRKHSFLWISWTPAQHQVQIEKIPLANFNIGRTTVLPTQPLFQARSSDLSPWAHKAGFLFHPQASLMKTPLGRLPLQTPSREAQIHLSGWSWALSGRKAGGIPCCS